MADPQTRMVPVSRVQRVLARYELGCPSLRDFQVTVEILGPRPTIVVVPASAHPRGQVQLVITGKGRLRTCVTPQGLSPGQRAAVEDLAWALYEALAEEGAPRRSPAAAEPSK